MVRQALGFDLWAMTDARHIAEDAAAIDDDDDQARRGAETSAAATSAPIVAPTTKSNRRGNKRSQVTCVTATRPSKRIVFVRHGHAESNAGTGRFPWVVDVAVRVVGIAQTMTIFQHRSDRVRGGRLFGVSPVGIFRCSADGPRQGTGGIADWILPRCWVRAAGIVSADAGASNRSHRRHRP